MTLHRGVVAGLAVLCWLVASPSAAVTLNPGDIIVAHQFLGQAGLVRVDPLTGAQTNIPAGGSLDEPRGIAIDSAGNIIVADQATGGDGAILQIDPTTGTQMVVAMGGTFIDPFGIAIDAAGQIIITDRSPGGGVYRVDPLTGSPTVITTGGLLTTPYGIAIDSLGQLIVADDPAGTVPNPGLGRLIKIDPLTGVQTLIRSGGHPFFVAIDAAGDYIVTDRDDITAPPTTSSVVRIDATTGVQTLITALPDGQAYGVAINSLGQIITPDNWNARLLAIDPVTGTQSVVSSDGFFTTPTGVAIVPGGPEVSPPTVAEPSTLFLLASGLAAVVVTRRDRGDHPRQRRGGRHTLARKVRGRTQGALVSPQRCRGARGCLLGPRGAAPEWYRVRRATTGLCASAPFPVPVILV